jgi:cyclic pyranopterin phosphate synthase
MMMMMMMMIKATATKTAAENYLRKTISTSSSCTRTIRNKSTTQITTTTTLQQQQQLKLYKHNYHYRQHNNNNHHHHHHYYSTFSSRRWLSSKSYSSDIDNTDTTDTTDTSSTEMKTGQDQHAFFQEQMLELNREQKHFAVGEQQDDDDNNDNNDNDNNQISTASSTISSSSTSASFNNDLMEGQLNDWKNEQIHVFGEELQDHDDVNNSNSNNSDKNNDKNNSKNKNYIKIKIDDDIINDDNKKIEREDMFEFSDEDRNVWGKPPPSQNIMNQILNDIQIDRENQLKQQYQQQQSWKNASSITSASTSTSTTNVSNQSQSESESQSNENKNKNKSSLQQQHQQEEHQHHESFSHVNKDGTGVHMVDVGKKVVTSRTAHARSEVWLPSCVIEAFLPGINTSSSSSSSISSISSSVLEELIGPKGPIFSTAKIAGIMAAKKTSDLIPLCHPLPLDQVQINIQLLTPLPKKQKGNNNNNNNNNDGGGTVIIDCICRVTHKTGVEMEALMGASIAALTIYDMTKAVSHNIKIKDTRLISKTGGKRTVVLE